MTCPSFDFQESHSTNYFALTLATNLGLREKICQNEFESNLQQTIGNTPLP